MEEPCGAACAPKVIEGAGHLYGVVPPIGVSIAVFALAGGLVLGGGWLLWRGVRSGRPGLALLAHLGCGLAALFLVSERVYIATEAAPAMAATFILQYWLLPVAGPWLLTAVGAVLLARRATKVRQGP